MRWGLESWCRRFIPSDRAHVWAQSQSCHTSRGCCCIILTSFLGWICKVELIQSQIFPRNQSRSVHNRLKEQLSFSSLQTQIRLFIWRLFSASDAMKCNDWTKRAWGVTGRPDPVSPGESLRLLFLELHSPSGINGRAVCFNQISSNLSLAPRCWSESDERHLD